jgi:flagellar motility protein MotE (MotC chaperone)
MSGKAHRRVKRRRSETGALQILEEAFHLVRSADVKSFWLFYLGAVPWAVGLLYFVADMGRSSLAARDAAFAALALTGLWMWMRLCQAKFCASLWERLNPGSLPRTGFGERLRALAALWFLQAFQIPALALGIVFAIPLGWILAAQQNVSVLALTRAPGDRPLRELLGRSLRHSHDQWAQNHGILLVFLFVFLFTWINLVATCIAVPGLVKSIFGVESLFTLAPSVAASNTTFVLGTLLLAQLAIVPLYNAAYVLRCVYAGSRASGADLLSRLAACRERRRIEEQRERGSLGRVALVAVCLLSGAAAPVARAGEGRASPSPSVPAAGSDEAERFRGEIAETLERKKYQWRLSRRVEEGEEEAGQSWLGERLEEIAESVKRLLKAIEDWIEDAMRRLMERNPGASEDDTKKDSAFFKKLGSTASLALVAVLLGLLLWLAAAIYFRYRGRERTEIAAEGGGGPIDLESEDIVATQLREDEWLRLAREQIEKGEERLAIRALFLATLAHLGERGLLKIARFKSNRDYRAELLLRARGLADLRRAFDENTTLFERVWYGLHRPASGSVEGYLKNHGLIAEESARANRPTAVATARP